MSELKDDLSTYEQAVPNSPSSDTELGKIVEPDEAVEMDPEPEQLMHGVCLFVSNNRQNGFADRAQFFCWTSCDPKKGLWRIEYSNICL